MKPEASPASPASRASLLRHADFRRLWAAQAVSAFGSRITRTALPIIAVRTLGEPETMVAALAAMQLAPGVVLALFTGGFVDRSHKRRILVAMDLLRGLFILSLTAAWALGVLSMWHVIAVGALVGAASALFSIADIAYLPHVVEKHQLGEGNAKLQATDAIAEVTGPASAGALIAALGAPLAVVVDAVSFVWSAFMLGRVRAVEKPAGVEPSAQSSTWQSSRDLRVGMRAVFGHPQVRPIVIAWTVWSITGGFFAALYTLYCLRVLGLPESTFGVIVAMGGIGSLAGAMLARPMVRKLGLGPTLIVSAALSCAATLFIPLASGSHTLVLLSLTAHQFLGDGFAVVFIVHSATLRQTVLPKELLGRANAAVHVCVVGMLPVAALAAGVLAQLTTIRFAMWAGVLVGLAVPLFLLPLRRLREMPEAARSYPS